MASGRDGEAGERRGAAGVPAARSGTVAVPAGTSPGVAAFVGRQQARQTKAAARERRLVFIMDATGSRGPGWQLAMPLQAELFDTVRKLGAFAVQLVCFGGTDNCRASKWVRDADTLVGLMRLVEPQSGLTQIVRALRHVLSEAEGGPIDAVVYVGDHCEDDPEACVAVARDLKARAIPLFILQEGDEPVSRGRFEAMARASGGATGQFAPGAGATLKEMLAAVMMAAAVGREAALAASSGAGRLLLEKLDRD